jgi:dTDP-4-dehydrorhamnose 3,5-epimerase
VSAVLSAAEWNQILVPAGFAHCFVTLEPDTEVIYKVTDYWSPEHERGILWCDPDLGIDWGIAPEEAVVSDKDKTWPRLSEQRDLFE